MKKPKREFPLELAAAVRREYLRLMKVNEGVGDAAHRLTAAFQDFNRHAAEIERRGLISRRGKAPL